MKKAKRSSEKRMSDANKLKTLISIYIVCMVLLLGVCAIAEKRNEVTLNELYTITKDTSTVEIEDVVNYGRSARGYYSVVDVDGVKANINTDLVDLIKGNIFKVGDFIKVTRSRYFDKDTGKEMYRDYKFYKQVGNLR